MSLSLQSVASSASTPLSSPQANAECWLDLYHNGLVWFFWASISYKCNHTTSVLLLSRFFHFSKCLWDLSIWSCVSVVHSFLLLTIRFHKYTPIYLFTCWWTCWLGLVLGYYEWSFYEIHIIVFVWTCCHFYYCCNQRPAGGVMLKVTYCSCAVALPVCFPLPFIFHFLLFFF